MFVCVCVCVHVCVRLCMCNYHPLPTTTSVHWQFYGKEPKTDTLMSSAVYTPPLSSHGSCNPIDEYPFCTEEPCDCRDRVGVSTTNGAIGLVATCWLTPLLMGTMSPSLGSGITSTSTSMCIYVCG